MFLRYMLKLCGPIASHQSSSGAASGTSPMTPLSPNSRDTTPPIEPLDHATERSSSLFLSLPVEIKRLIPPFLERPDQIALVRTHSAWRDIVEETLWRTLVINPRAHPYSPRTLRRNAVWTQQDGSSAFWSFGFGDDQHHVKAVDLLLADEWKVAEQTLSLRPIRRKYVQKLEVAASHRAGKIVNKLLEDFAPTLRSLQLSTVCCHFAGCKNTSSALERLSSIPAWPNLVDLELSISVVPGWFSRILHVIRRAPQLQTLSIHTGSQLPKDVSADCQWAIPDCFDLDLPALRSLTVVSFRWRGIVHRLLPHAPRMQFLAVDHGKSTIDHTVYGFVDPDADLDGNQPAHVAIVGEGVPRPGQMERVFGGHKSLRHLIVHDPLAHRGFPAAESSRASWLPNLESLVLHDKVSITLYALCRVASTGLRGAFGSR